MYVIILFIIFFLIIINLFIFFGVGVGNIPANMNPAILRTIFQAFGAIESVRVLSHKNCGFINFDHQEDAVRARKSLQNKEILGTGTGAVRIGFAKVPPNNPEEEEEDTQPSLSNSSSNPSPPTSVHQTIGSETYQNAQWTTAMMMMMMNSNTNPPQQNTPPSLYSAIASERLFIMQQLGLSDPSEKIKADRVPITYFSVIPAVPELNGDRKLEPLRLREMRKRLENDEQQSPEEIEGIAHECMEEVVELCSGKYMYLFIYRILLLNTRYFYRLYWKHSDSKIIRILFRWDKITNVTTYCTLFSIHWCS